MSLIINADDFEVGMFITGIGRVDETYDTTTMDGNVVTLQASQSHHNGNIYKVVNVDILPFIMVEMMWHSMNACIGKKDLVDIRYYNFRRVSKEVLEQLRSK